MEHRAPCHTEGDRARGQARRCEGRGWERGHRTCIEFGKCSGPGFGNMLTRLTALLKFALVAGKGPGLQTDVGKALTGTGVGPCTHTRYVMHMSGALGTGCGCPAGPWLLLPLQRSARPARARVDWRTRGHGPCTCYAVVRCTLVADTVLGPALKGRLDAPRCGAPVGFGDGTALWAETERDRSEDWTEATSSHAPQTSW